MIPVPQLPEDQGSKTKLLQTTMFLLASKGFESTGINEILEKAKVTKSNFYYHFESKEALALAALDAMTDFFSQHILKETFLNTSLSPQERLHQFVELSLSTLEENQCRQGCPFVNLAAETSDFYPKFREKMELFFRHYQNAIQFWYQDGINLQQFRDDLPPEQVAQLILSCLNGSFVLVKTQKRTTVLSENLQTLISLLEKNPLSSARTN